MGKLRLSVGLLVFILSASVAAVLRGGPDSVPWGRFLLLAAGNLVQQVDELATRGEAREEPDGQADAGLTLTHGVAVGDVTASTAVVWTRASGRAFVHVEYQGGSMARPLLAPAVFVSEASDYTAAVRLDGLEPHTLYTYEVWMERLRERPERIVSEGGAGSFRTALSPDAAAPVAFVFGGDLGGGGYCRKPTSGYAIFGAMRDLAPDFFVASGDMIYADNSCPSLDPDGSPNIPGGFLSVASARVDWNRPDEVREVYWQHWRYNRGDRQLQQLLRTTPMYAQWDDHEIINDGGAGWSYWNPLRAGRTGFSNLARAARDAFFAYSAIDLDRADQDRIYRRFGWGKHFDLFRLDVRSFRSRNEVPDTPENQKTMLGREQLAWLKAELGASMATWKVVSSGVPLALPTGGFGAAVLGRDGWANGTSWDFSSQTGFERELLDLFRYLDDHGVTNVVFLSGDAHLAMSVRYAIDVNGDGQPLVFHELAAGPLSAATNRGETALDPTLNPTVLYRESGFFNFGYARVEEGLDGATALVADVRGEDGQPRPGSVLRLRGAGPD